MLRRYAAVNLLVVAWHPFLQLRYRERRRGSQRWLQRSVNGTHEPNMPPTSEVSSGVTNGYKRRVSLEGVAMIVWAPMQPDAVGLQELGEKYVG